MRALPHALTYPLRVTDPWADRPYLAALAALYAEDARDPTRYSDDEIVATIAATLWGTNAWDYAQAAFAVIAPACARRPALAPRLLPFAVEPLFALAITDPATVVEIGVALAAAPSPYVPLHDEARPFLRELARETATIAAILAALEAAFVAERGQP